MEAIVLAGGLGTRLAPRLNGIPKPMVPVCGRPFLEILLGNLQRRGCSRAVLSVGHLSSVIREHFGTAFEGMQLDYAIELSPLGTGGAIRAALPLATETTVLVLNGDTFLDVDYAAMLAFHTEQQVELTMAVTQQPDVARYGGVVLQGERVSNFAEKGQSGPGWINAGVYILQKHMLWPNGLPECFSFETAYLVPRVEQQRFAAYRLNKMFLDIGVPEDLDRAQIILMAYRR